MAIKQYKFTGSGLKHLSGLISASELTAINNSRVTKTKNKTTTGNGEPGTCERLHKAFHNFRKLKEMYQ
jgi:hypothetical protein